MNKNLIECMACGGSFRSERQYTKHKCLPVSKSPQIKEEPMEMDDHSEAANIVVKIEPNDLLGFAEEVDPLSFTSVKEENVSYDEPYLDVKPEKELMAPQNAEHVNKIEDDEELTATAAKFLSTNTNLKCNVCCKTFQSHKTFNRHVSVHNSFKPYSCSVCDKKFLQKHYVTLHMRVHTGERPYACPICPKKYTHKTSFTIHMRIHRGERPYECGICGKKCYDKSGLTSHIRSHTKETPYKCDVCDRRFTHSKSLLVHKRNHTGEKPYICRYCGKAFRHWHKHKIHVRLHTGERPYKCKVCGKGFPRNDEVKRHMRSHTGIKSFRCSICEAYCATQGSITGHINLHHSNLKNGEIAAPEKTKGMDGNSRILSNTAPEPRSIYSNIALQSSYVAKILMTAKNLKENKKSEPSTKVIEITTKDNPPRRPIKLKFKTYGSPRPTTESQVSKLENSEKHLNYKEFLAWQEKMLEKQGLVVKGLPADDDTSERKSVKVTPTLPNPLGQTIVAGKQQYILLLQPGKNSSASKMMVPINNAGTKVQKTPIDIPSPLGTPVTTNKPYLIVPESVAAQPMFLLSSGSQKVLLTGSQPGAGNLACNASSQNQPSSTRVKEENISPIPPTEFEPLLNIKQEPND